MIFILHGAKLHKLLLLRNVIISPILRLKYFCVFDNVAVLCVQLFGVEMHEDNLKKIETCSSISGLN